MNAFTVNITIGREVFKESSLDMQTGIKSWQKNFYLVPAIFCACLGLYSLLVAPKDALLGSTHVTFVLLVSSAIMFARKKIALYRLGKQYDADAAIGRPHTYVISDDSIAITGHNFSETYPRAEITKVVSTTHYVAVIANKHTCILLPAEQLTAEQKDFIMRTFAVK